MGWHGVGVDHATTIHILEAHGLQQLVGHRGDLRRHGQHLGGLRAHVQALQLLGDGLGVELFALGLGFSHLRQQHVHLRLGLGLLHLLLLLHGGLLLGRDFRILVLLPGHRADALEHLVFEWQVRIHLKHHVQQRHHHFRRWPGQLAQHAHQAVEGGHAVGLLPLLLAHDELGLGPAQVVDEALAVPLVQLLELACTTRSRHRYRARLQHVLLHQRERQGALQPAGAQQVVKHLGGQQRTLVGLGQNGLAAGAVAGLLAVLRRHARQATHGIHVHLRHGHQLLHVAVVLGFAHPVASQCTIGKHRDAVRVLELALDLAQVHGGVVHRAFLDVQLVAVRQVVRAHDPGVQTVLNVHQVAHWAVRQAGFHASVAPDRHKREAPMVKRRLGLHQDVFAGQNRAVDGPGHRVHDAAHMLVLARHRLAGPGLQ